MRMIGIGCVGLVVLFAAAWAQAGVITFGTGANQFSMTFNSVSASQEEGATEVLNDQIDKFYLATTGHNFRGETPTDTARWVKGKNAVEFINWLNTSWGLPAAYTFTDGNHNSLVNWNRAAGAKFFLPTEAEWNAGLSFIGYAPGLCAYEWIQDTGGNGGNMDGVDDGSPNKSWDDPFGASYFDTGFRVISDPRIAVPEPATMALLAVGGIATLLRRKRK